MGISAFVNATVSARGEHADAVVAEAAVSETGESTGGGPGAVTAASFIFHDLFPNPAPYRIDAKKFPQSPS